MTTIEIALAAFVAGVVFHAAVIAWVDRLRDLAKTKWTEEIAKKASNP